MYLLIQPLWWVGLTAFALIGPGHLAILFTVSTILVLLHYPLDHGNNPYSVGRTLSDGIAMVEIAFLAVSIGVIESWLAIEALKVTPDIIKNLGLHWSIAIILFFYVFGIFSMRPVVVFLYQLNHTARHVATLLGVATVLWLGKYFHIEYLHQIIVDMEMIFLPCAVGVMAVFLFSDMRQQSKEQKKRATGVERAAT